MSDPSMEKLLRDFLASQPPVPTHITTPKPEPFYSPKNINALVIAAIIGLVAFMWSGVTQQPEKNAETRTILLEMRASLGSLNTKIESLQRDTNETRSGVDRNTAEIEGLKRQVQANSDRIQQLERDTR